MERTRSRNEENNMNHPLDTQALTSLYSHILDDLTRSHIRILGYIRDDISHQFPGSGLVRMELYPPRLYRDPRARTPRIRDKNVRKTRGQDGCIHRPRTLWCFTHFDGNICLIQSKCNHYPLLCDGK